MHSVVIPTFNRAHFLERTLTSVFNQILLPAEIILVDDGSTDNTKEVVVKLQERSPVPLKYIFQQNSGVSGARNTGVGSSSPDSNWISFLDSDDHWHPNKLEIQGQYLKDNPDCQAMHSNERWLYNNKEVKQKAHQKKYGGEIFKECLRSCCISPSTFLIHRKLFLSLGGFDPSFEVCEDYELWLRLSCKHLIHLVEDTLVTKEAGHDDQLSFKYRVMDSWRLKAIYKLLKSNVISKDQFNSAKEIFNQKAQIVSAGYLKYGRVKEFQQLKKMSESLGTDTLVSP